MASFTIERNDFWEGRIKVNAALSTPVLSSEKDASFFSQNYRSESVKEERKDEERKAREKNVRIDVQEFQSRVKNWSEREKLRD